MYLEIFGGAIRGVKSLQLINWVYSRQMWRSSMVVDVLGQVCLSCEFCFIFHPSALLSILGKHFSSSFDSWILTSSLMGALGEDWVQEEVFFLSCFTSQPTKATPIPWPRSYWAAQPHALTSRFWLPHCLPFFSLAIGFCQLPIASSLSCLIALNYPVLSSLAYLIYPNFACIEFSTLKNLLCSVPSSLK